MYIFMYINVYRFYKHKIIDWINNSNPLLLFFLSDFFIQFSIVHVMEYKLFRIDKKKLFFSKKVED